MGNNVTSDFFSMIPFGKISTGFFIGLAVGYFLKKSLKLVLLLFGLLIVVLFALQSHDIIHINNGGLIGNANKLVALLKGVGSFAKENLSFLQVSGASGAMAGFFSGLKLG